MMSPAQLWMLQLISDWIACAIMCCELLSLSLTHSLSPLLSLSPSLSLSLSLCNCSLHPIISPLRHWLHGNRLRRNKKTIKKNVPESLANLCAVLWQLVSGPVGARSSAQHLLTKKDPKDVQALSYIRYRLCALNEAETCFILWRREREKTKKNPLQSAGWGWRRGAEERKTEAEKKKKKKDGED